MKSLALSAAFILSASIAQAEQLSGTEVAQLLGSGDLVFEAGSVGSFKSDSTYSFRHANGVQSGTYTLFSNGMVTFEDNGTDYTFVVDRKRDGRLEVQYTAGPWRGDAYMLR